MQRAVCVLMAPEAARQWQATPLFLQADRLPDRLAIFIAQILRPKGRLTRVMMTVAASYKQRRASVPTLRYMSAAVDIARLILSGGESQVRAHQA